MTQQDHLYRFRAPDIARLLTRFLEKERLLSVFIWGPPGVGKSDIVRQVGGSMNRKVIDARLSQMDNTDLRGIIFPRDDKAIWLVPSFLPDVERDGEYGILFLDELNSAPPLVQAAAYQLVLDRRIGDYHLPQGWSIIAAGNRSSDRGVTYRMPTPLANRFVHVEFEVNLDDWTAWAVGHGVRQEIIGFVQFRPSLLFAMSPEKDDVAFPSPRSWYKLSLALNALELPQDNDLVDKLTAGVVGDGASTELAGYFAVYKYLPDIDAILNGGKAYPDKDKSALCYATVTALGLRSEDKHITHLLDWSFGLPSPEFAVLLGKILKARKQMALVKAPNYHKWIAKFQTLMNA